MVGKCEGYVPQFWKIPQYCNSRLKLPKYRMKNGPILPYGKPQCPPLFSKSRKRNNSQFMTICIAMQICDTKRSMVWQRCFHELILLLLDLAAVNHVSEYRLFNLFAYHIQLHSILCIRKTSGLYVIYCT